MGIGGGSFGTVKNYRAPDLEPVLKVFGCDGVNKGVNVIVVVANEKVVVGV